MNFRSILALSCLVFCALPVSAHVVVSPSTASASSYQTFAISVPSERAAATTGVRLVLPAGVSSVTPNVKPGWNVVVHKETVGTTTIATEIVWTGGSVPSGLRDEFAFSVKTPSSGSLVWKAYQTYSDGKTVNWDETMPEGHAHDHESTEGPASITAIAAPTTQGKTTSPMSAMSWNPWSYFLPLLALRLTLANMADNEKKQA